jgi:CRP-like cAMP-binding protein
LLKLLQHDPRFTSAVLRSLARRIQRYQRALNEFVMEPAERRLVLLLLRLTKGRRRSNWVRLPFEFTNGHLSKAIGTTRGRVSYFLNRFERLGFLRRRNGLELNVSLAEEFLEPSNSIWERHRQAQPSNGAVSL